MPYTPPAQSSPAASKPNSPTPSRSQSSFQAKQASAEPGAAAAATKRSALPRSSASQSYLTKHRRSPSLNAPPKDVLHHGESYEVGSSDFDPHGSLRKSPPPVKNGRIPPGMTISPPESVHTSDDEENVRGRVRDLEEENLKQLQAAIQIIQQKKESSPVRTAEDRARIEAAEQLLLDQDDGSRAGGAARPPLSREARKISHSRSNTDSSIVLDVATLPTSASLTDLRADLEDESDGSTGESRPPMLRKKSGELVRPALRASSRRRPSSMPGTPTYSKAVHFDSHLEHVRHFLQVDRPLAVSAGSSPVENYESENEFPFGGSEEDNARPRQQPFEWEIKLPNFTPLAPGSRQCQAVQVERIFLSADNKNLIGCIAVQNIAFHKSVVIRFTFDYWKTTSELVAEFNHDVRPAQQSDGLDRFTFSLKLADQVNLANKSLFFCVRYNVDGQEFWDNNNGYNYQVGFCKKPKQPQYGKNGMPGLGARPLTALPRSNSQAPPRSSRPRTSPASFDDFTSGFDNFTTSSSSSSASVLPTVLMGEREPSIKFKGNRAKPEFLLETPTRKKSTSGPKFGYRYDFSSSLSATRNNSVFTPPAAAHEKHSSFASFDTKQSSHQVDAVKTAATKSVSDAAPVKSVQAQPVSKAPAAAAAAAAAAPVSSAAAASSKPGTLFTEKPSLSSQSYRELVEKYCFFGTPKSSTPLTKTALNLVDGTVDDVSTLEFTAPSLASTPSESGSPKPTAREALLTEVSTGLRHYGSSADSRSSSPLPFITGSRPTSPAFSYAYNASSQLMAEAPTSIRA